MVNEQIEENINRNQFGGMGGASTTDALVEMIHRWSEATDKLDHYVIVALLDFSKAFGRERETSLFATRWVGFKHIQYIQYKYNKIPTIW